MRTRQVVEITWLDACAFDRAGIEIEEKSPRELLFPIKSYGYILKEDRKAIILTHEDSTDQKSFVVIPKKWIKNITRLGKIKQIKKQATLVGAKVQRRTRGGDLDDKRSIS